MFNNQIHFNADCVFTNVIKCTKKTLNEKIESKWHFALLWSEKINWSWNAKYILNCKIIKLSVSEWGICCEPCTIRSLFDKLHCMTKTWTKNCKFHHNFKINTYSFVVSKLLLSLSLWKHKLNKRAINKSLTLRHQIQ